MRAPVAVLTAAVAVRPALGTTNRTVKTPSRQVLAHLHSNAALNGLQARCSSMHLDWRAPAEGLAAGQRGCWRLLLAADVLYASAVVQPLIDTLRLALHPQGAFLQAHRGRGWAEAPRAAGVPPACILAFLPACLPARLPSVGRPANLLSTSWLRPRLCAPLSTAGMQGVRSCCLSPYHPRPCRPAFASQAVTATIFPVTPFRRGPGWPPSAARRCARPPDPPAPAGGQGRAVGAFQGRLRGPGPGGAAAGQQANLQARGERPWAPPAGWCVPAGQDSVAPGLHAVLGPCRPAAPETRAQPASDLTWCATRCCLQQRGHRPDGAARGGVAERGRRAGPPARASGQRQRQQRRQPLTDRPGWWAIA